MTVQERASDAELVQEIKHYETMAADAYEWSDYDAMRLSMLRELAARRERELVVGDCWPEGVAVVRVANAAPGYEWMAFDSAGKHHDLMGKHRAHNATLAGLLREMGGVE